MSESTQATTGSVGAPSIDADIWKMDFAQNCLYIFGAPTTIKNCLDKEERYYFSYCTVCLAMAMKENSDILLSYMGSGIDVEDAAYCFAEFYESHYGDTLIPLYKNASPSYTEGGLGDV